MAQQLNVQYELLRPVNNPTGNPSTQGYKEIVHGSISSASIGDSVNSTDTTVNSNKTYYGAVIGTADNPAGSRSRSSDNSGYRGGGDADTEEAGENRGKLLDKALDYIKHHYKPESFEVTVKAVDIHLLDPTVSTIGIGDVIKVVLADGTEKKGTCLKIQYDLMAPENTEYTIGDAEKSIA